MKYFKDPIVEEVRRTRRKIEKQCGDDPEKLFRFYLSFQEKYRSRLVSRKPQPALRKAKAG